MYDIVLAFISSLILTYFAIPSIISIAEKKELVDEPGDRRSHKVKTPSLGGIGIFAGVIFSVILWTPFKYFGDLQYILSAFVIIFLIGAKDDIDPISPTVKFAGQAFAALILIFFSKVMISNFWGVFGIYEINYWFGVVFSFLTIMTIVNAFNLIDGINALSASIGVLVCVTFGSWFYLTDNMALAIVAFSLAGSIIAFLRFNVTPAKIFMGDTGSLLIGMVAAILAIQFIESHHSMDQHQLKFVSAPAVAIGILIIPIFDTFRVFTIRIIKGRSPFSADRNHIHHVLINLGLSHMQATFSLVLANLIFIIVCIRLHHLGTSKLLFLLLVLCLIGSFLLSILSKRGLFKENSIEL